MKVNGILLCSKNVCALSYCFSHTEAMHVFPTIVQCLLDCSVIIYDSLSIIYTAFSDYNIFSLNRNLFSYPMTKCHGTFDCDPQGYDRRGNDITGLSIQNTLQTKLRSTHLDKLNTGETKYVKMIFFILKDYHFFFIYSMKIFRDKD